MDGSLRILPFLNPSFSLIPSKYSKQLEVNSILNLKIHKNSLIDIPTFPYFPTSPSLQSITTKNYIPAKRGSGRCGYGGRFSMGKKNHVS